MSTQFTVPLTKVISTMKLEVAYMPSAEKEIVVSSTDIDRPGLQLAGFFGYFENHRMQLIGKSELAYLDQMEPAQEEQAIENYMAKQPVAVVLTWNNRPSDLFLEKARKYGVPLLVTPEATTSFSAALAGFLSVELAPRVTRHGVLMEVSGEGVLLLGDSGVGKSETAIELVKRGHRLIADDAVEIRRVSNKTLVGSSPANIRHFLELRGIGIINVRRLFGIGAVKVTGRIDMIMNMEVWDPEKLYDRMGMEDEYTDILGIPVPSVTVPVKPGRNLAMIIEVAAINNRQKRLGYNASHELLARLGMAEDIPKIQRRPITDYDEFYY